MERDSVTCPTLSACCVCVCVCVCGCELVRECFEMLCILVEIEWCVSVCVCDSPGPGLLSCRESTLACPLSMTLPWFNLQELFQ